MCAAYETTVRIVKHKIKHNEIITTYIDEKKFLMCNDWLYNSSHIVTMSCNDYKLKCFCT